MKKRSLLALILCGSLCGCQTWMKSYVAVHDAVDAVLADGQEAGPLPAGQAPVLWDAYYVAEWTAHTDQGNLDRAAGIKAAQASGKTCIGFKFKNDSGAFKIAVYKWESDVDKGKFLEGDENWTDKALRAGIRQWCVNIQGSDLDVIKDTFKAYGPGTDYQVQFTGIPITRDVMKALECDGQGIKTTPPRYR
jgi:hypothetical protein